MNLKSPFRYPGGKAKISKPILNKIKEKTGFQTIFSDSNMEDFVDVFAGGGSVSLSVLNEYDKIKSLHMNDSDDWVYSFWYSMIDRKEGDRLKQYIKKYQNPSIKDFYNLRKSMTRKGLSIGYKGFLGLFFNRTTFSGIFTSGPIGGKEQKSDYKINCRYNSLNLLKRINHIQNHFNNINVEITKLDFREIIKKWSNNEKAFLYLDPPYMKQGHQLYNQFMNDLDYIEMANLLKNSRCHWMISHDDYKPFVDLFQGWTNISSIKGVPYTINSIAENRKTELLIVKN